MNRKAAMNEASERKGVEVVWPIAEVWISRGRPCETNTLSLNEPSAGSLGWTRYVPASSLSTAVAERDSAVRARDSYHARVFELIAERDALAAKLAEATAILRELVAGHVMTSQPLARAFLHDPKEALPQADVKCPHSGG